MADQLPALGDLSSIFQFAAGVSFAMSVFRAPYEQLYQRLGKILDREEIVLRGRSGDLADEQGQRVLNARMTWLSKGKELEPIITRLERWVWASVAISSLGLVSAAVWPNFELRRWLCCALILSSVGPFLVGATLINLTVIEKLSGLKRDLSEL